MSWRFAVRASLVAFVVVGLGVPVGLVGSLAVARMMGEGMMGSGMMGGGIMGRYGTTPTPGSGGHGSDTQGKGDEVFAEQCAICHAAAPEASSRAGPNLYGVVGRRAGSLLGYPYSAAMRHSRLVWDRRTLSRFLADPQAVVPGTIMPYPGLRDRAARQALLDYLRSATQ
jgi:cytochrome c